MVVILVLGVSGDIVEHDKKLKNKLGDEMNLTSLKGVVNAKGKGKFKRQVIWNFENMDIHVYAYNQGTKDQQLNTHKLPKPLEKAEFYGDIVLIATNDDNFIDYTESNYYEFYTNSQYDNTIENDEDQQEDIDNLSVVSDHSDKSDDTEVEIEIEYESDEEGIDTSINIIHNNELQLEHEYLG